MILEDIGLCAQNILIILGSIANMIGGGGPIWLFNIIENFDIDNE